MKKQAPAYKKQKQKNKGWDEYTICTYCIDKIYEMKSKQEIYKCNGWKHDKKDT
jgi:hypothetical protein